MGTQKIQVGIIQFSVNAMRIYTKSNEAKHYKGQTFLKIF